MKLSNSQLNKLKSGIKNGTSSIAIEKSRTKLTIFLKCVLKRIKRN